MSAIQGGGDATQAIGGARNAHGGPSCVPWQCEHLGPGSKMAAYGIPEGWGECRLDQIQDVPCFLDGRPPLQQ